MAVSGEIFDIADDLSVCRSADGIYGVGSGSDYAVGAIHAGAKPEKAIEIAAKLDVNTSGPIQIVEQYKQSASVRAWTKHITNQSLK